MHWKAVNCTTHVCNILHTHLSLGNVTILSDISIDSVIISGVGRELFSRHRSYSGAQRDLDRLVPLLRVSAKAAPGVFLHTPRQLDPPAFGVEGLRREDICQVPQVPRRRQKSD